MAKIYVKFNSAVIKEIPIDKDEISIGRKPNNDIAIDHPTISGFHGKIKKMGDHYIIEDLNSTNGTFLNGQRIKSGRIKHKDQVGIAGHVLEFITDKEPDNLPAPVENTPDLNQEEPKKDSIESQREMLRKSLGLPPKEESSSISEIQNNLSPEPPKTDLKYGVIRIVSGGVNGQTEILLKDLVTYIGGADQSAIKIKGFLVPGLAAAISRRPEGYFLKAVKAGYPKVNGTPVKEQIFLENGALIEAGGTNMVFYHNDAKKTTDEEKGV
ncbi:MAG: FHA domain-containing protein [Elusimicrobiota bacterium]